MKRRKSSVSYITNVETHSTWYNI